MQSGIPLYMQTGNQSFMQNDLWISCHFRPNLKNFGKFTKFDCVKMGNNLEVCNKYLCITITVLGTRTK